MDYAYTLKKYLQKGDRILLYGKGENGRKLYSFLKGQPQFHVVGIVARNADQVVNPEVPMYCPEQLKMIPPSDYDKIIITVMRQEMGMEICQIIRDSGVSEDKIVAPYTYIGPTADISVKSFTSSPWRVREEIEKFISNQYGNLLYFDSLINELKKCEHIPLLEWSKTVVNDLPPVENIVFLYILYLADIFDAELMKSLVESALKINRTELREFLLGVYNDELSMTFLYEKYLFPEYYVLRRTFTAQLCKMYDFKIQADKIKKNSSGKINKILITIDTLLTHRHSPTLVSIHMSEILTELGYEVRVMPMDNYSNSLWEYPIFRPIYNLSDWNSKIFEDYHREAYPDSVIIEYSDIVDGKERMQSELDKIVAFSPDLIIDRCGDTSIISCIYSKYFPTLYLSTGGCQSSAYFDYYGVVNHDAFVEANEIYHSVDYEKEVPRPLSHITPKAYTRYDRCGYPQAALEDGDFVLISVGNRIGTELTEDFIDIVCEKLLTKQNIKWLILGGQNDYLSHRYQELLETNKIVYIPYEDDLPALYQICDVFLSPKRQGGGTSVFWAMYYGLPIAQPVSLQADAIAIAGSENIVCKTYEQLVEYILKLWEYPKEYAEASDKARKRALHIEGTQKQAWKDFMDLIEMKQREKSLSDGNLLTAET